MNHFIKSSRKKRRVLVVDDEMINRELLEAILAFNYEVDCASNGKEAMDMLYAAAEPYSLILLDLLMPKMSGFQVLEACKGDEALKRIPIIVMTSEKSAEVRSIRLGADDFITKPYRMPEVILARCERIVELSEEKSLIRSIEKDKVTGLYTEDFFYAYIRRAPATRFDMDAAVIRVEGLGRVSACCGDDGLGDMLRSASELIRSELVGAKGIAGHMEPGVFYIYCKHSDDLEERIGNIDDALHREVASKEFSLRAGVYAKVDKTADPELWFKRAETACALSQQAQGRSVNMFTDEMLSRENMRTQLYDEVLSALEDGQFLMKYRPRYAIAGGKTELAAAEAELYWQHPQYGLLGPEELASLLRGHPYACEVMRFMVTDAASNARRWRDRRSSDIPVALPMFCSDCTDLGAPERMEAVARRFSLPVSLFKPVIDCDSSLAGVIRAFGESGFEVELSGFGAGGMNLCEMSRVPVSTLRLDRCLTDGMLGSADVKNALDNAVKIAAVLNRKTVVCGVKNQAQLELLRELACDYASGDALSQALNADEMG